MHVLILIHTAGGVTYPCQEFTLNIRSTSIILERIPHEAMNTFLCSCNYATSLDIECWNGFMLVRLLAWSLVQETLEMVKVR